MNISVHEVADEDVLESFFGDDAPPRSIDFLITEHGEPVYDGHWGVVPSPGDTLMIGGRELGVVCRILDPEGDSVRVVVHDALCRGGEGAS